MKETILAIACVLAVTLIVFAVVQGVFWDSQEQAESFSDLTNGAGQQLESVERTTTEEPTTQEPTTEEPTTEEPTTEEPTTEEPTTEEPTTETTLPEIQLIASGQKFIVDGISVETFVTDEDETILVGADEYLAALGLDKDGTRHASEKELVILSADGSLLSVNDKAYDTVVEGKLYLPIYEFAEEFGYPMWVDEEYETVYITPAAKSFEIPENVNVPVLMYHAVSDYCWGYAELFVSPSNMEKQLKYLVDNGYDPIWFEDLAHVEDYDKPVILTFDDGYDDNYTNLFPLLQQYNVKATVFIIGQDVSGTNHKMNEEQIIEMSNSGLVSIQSHSYTHGDMGSMSETTLEYEIGETQKVLTRLTGKIPYVLCYPSGKFSTRTIEVAQRHNLNFGLKMVGGLYNTSVDDPYKISRYYIARSTDIYTFSAYISSAG